MEYRDVLRHLLLFSAICLGTSVLEVVVSSVRMEPPVSNLRELWTDPVWWFGLLFTYYVVTRTATKRAELSHSTTE
ncbi:hypothetical protein A6E15_07700 [Natrinema saccharevitans]|uniref:Uncharacterized protein n=1 Tax=Natrinema saccharevitans TaxID=301967 RepID=A0A1S8AWC1_9EURY|nr:hypothetical protein [Natrinema saccharevitans]OLZ40881.1 hypothetical protein A6E15_07700 [Natrinema saccharevitans]